MKIVVCIKQVPDTAEVKLDPKTNTLIREGVPSIINHDDKAGLEAALRLREQVGGTVTVVCMGPPQADVALREALAMGVDEAYLLSAREFGGSDTYATATIIAAALKKIGFDLVITGRQAIDGDTAQVGPQIAEQLGVPQVSYAEELTLEDGSVVVKRQFEDQAHMLKVQLPCLVTALSELDEPRYMSTWGIVDAYEKDVTVWGFDDLKDEKACRVHRDEIRAIAKWVLDAKPDTTSLLQKKMSGAMFAWVMNTEEVSLVMDMNPLQLQMHILPYFIAATIEHLLGQNKSKLDCSDFVKVMMKVVYYARKYKDLLGLTEKELKVINQDDETLNALFKADFEKVSKKRNMKS